MCLSQEDVYRIAYLTQRGWTCSGEVWTKPGKTREITRHHHCGCCTYEEQTDEFDLEQAFWAQED
jgi:hypothetical protein